jgi:lipopolysaccharide export system permease protein
MAQKIWQRYLFNEILKSFTLFLGCFYFLYVTIDYSLHAKTFAEMPIGDVFIYYLCHFIKRAEVLIGFGMMLSTIKVLCSLNTSNELVALVTSGIKKRTLLQPFLIVAITCSAFLYLNGEFFIPKALSTIESIESHYLSEDSSSSQLKSINELPLSDDSIILYHHYDRALQAFFDVYWICSPDNILHMKYLYPRLEPPIGLFITDLARDDDGNFVIANSHEAKQLTEINFDEETLRIAITPPEYQSISQLWRQIPFDKEDLSDKEARIVTTFTYKTMIPFICLLAVIGPAPFCMRFSRHLRVFSLYGISIFLFVTFFTILDAATVLGENQITSPTGAIIAHFSLFFAVFGISYFRNTK